MHKGDGFSVTTLGKSLLLCPVIVWPASSDFWKAPLVWYTTQPASNCFKMHCIIHFIKSLELKRLRIQQEVGCN